MTVARFSKWIAERWNGQQKEQLNFEWRLGFPPTAALGLAGEVGEVLELLKKHQRDGKHPGDALRLELGDVLHYLTVIANAYGHSLDDLALGNMDKLSERDKQKGKQT